jgi:hypothetical protein
MRVRRDDRAADHAAVTDSEWFPCEGRTADDQAFLTELRRLVARSGLADVRPEGTGTTVHTWGWLVAWARVPGLEAGDADPQLQVGFGRSDGLVPPLVATWETHGFLLGNWDELVAAGRAGPPVAVAGQAFDWLSRQVRRPVELATWNRRRRKAVRLWRLADTGELITGDHAGFRLAERRPPDLVVRLR